MRLIIRKITSTPAAPIASTFASNLVRGVARGSAWGVALAVLLASTPVMAQGALLDDDDESLSGASAEARVTSDEKPAKMGLGLRLRQVHVLDQMLELFVGEAPGGAAHIGFGAEFIRQRGNFALSLGVEYEKLEAKEGLWLEKGDSIPQDEPDKIEFEDFGWVGVDINFTWNADLTSMFSLRYGAGLGVGLVLGNALRTDFRCATTELVEGDGQCTNSPMPEGPDRRDVEEIPPVFPIINMIIGAQFRPTDNIAINVEGGLRTLFPFAGGSVAYLF